MTPKLKFGDKVTVKERNGIVVGTDVFYDDSDVWIIFENRNASLYPEADVRKGWKKVK